MSDWDGRLSDNLQKPISREQADKIARSSGSAVKGVFENIQKRLNISDDDLHRAASTSDASSFNPSKPYNDIDKALALIYTMAKMRGMSLRLDFISGNSVMSIPLEHVPSKSDFHE